MAINIHINRDKINLKILPRNLLIIIHETATLKLNPAVIGAPIDGSSPARIEYSECVSPARKGNYFRSHIQ
jgi:hypothetical protein